MQKAEGMEFPAGSSCLPSQGSECRGKGYVGTREMLPVYTAAADIFPGWDVDQERMLVFLELPKDWQPKIFWALIFSHYFEFWGKKSRLPMS